jgi:hypothetical protein
LVTGVLLLFCKYQGLAGDGFFSGCNDWVGMVWAVLFFLGSVLSKPGSECELDVSDMRQVVTKSVLEVGISAGQNVDLAWRRRAARKIKLRDFNLDPTASIINFA